MRAPKFNFVPETQLSVSAPTVYRVSITKKGMLYFSKEVLEIYELANKYIRLFSDTEKKAIGWKVVTEEKSLADMKGLRKLTPNKTQLTASVSIQHLLKILSIDITEARKNIPVMKYSSGLLEEDIYYVELSN